MVSFFIVLLCFLLSFACHSILHRILRLRSACAYLIGAVLLFEFGKAGFSNLPWSSALLYALLSFTAILFYVALSLGTELPTSIILRSFQRKKQQTRDDLTGLFTDKRLIFERINDLVQSKLVTRTGSTLKLTGRGKVVWGVMELYKRVFHRTLTE